MADHHDKLVRDRIPEIVREDGKRPVTTTVEGQAYQRRLIAKLEEEVAEYRDSRHPRELVDVLEVVHALRTYHGLDADELAGRREAKAERNGRFDEGIVLDRVEE